MLHSTAQLKMQVRFTIVHPVLQRKQHPASAVKRCSLSDGMVRRDVETVVN